MHLVHKFNHRRFGIVSHSGSMAVRGPKKPRRRIRLANLVERSAPTPVRVVSSRAELRERHQHPQLAFSKAASNEGKAGGQWN